MYSEPEPVNADIRFDDVEGPRRFLNNREVALQEANHRVYQVGEQDGETKQQKHGSSDIRKRKCTAKAESWATRAVLRSRNDIVSFTATQAGCSTGLPRSFASCRKGSAAARPRLIHGNSADDASAETRQPACRNLDGDQIKSRRSSHP